MPRKRGETRKTSALGVRITPRAKHLIDIVCRNRRLSVTALFELAIESYASGYEMRIADATWSVDDRERIDLLHKSAPKLCSYEEEAFLKNRPAPKQAEVSTTTDYRFEVPGIPISNLDVETVMAAAKEVRERIPATTSAATRDPLTKLAIGPEEAAQATGHTRSAIYEAIASGELQSFKSGKRRLIRPQDLKAWIEAKARKGKR